MNEPESPASENPVGTSRRDAIKKIAVGGAIAWTTPLIVDSFASRAMAFTCTGPCYRVEISAECEVNDTSGGWKKPEVVCEPSCPPDHSGEQGTNGTVAGLGFSLVEARTRTWVLDGVTPNGIPAGWVDQNPAANGCDAVTAGVPEASDGTTHGGIDRYRVWQWDAATFGGAVGSCTNPKIESIAGSQLLKEVTFAPGGTTSADWIPQVPTSNSCCGVDLSASLAGSGCTNISVPNTDGDAPSNPMVYTDGRFSASLATTSTSPYQQQATFQFDGRFQAMKSMSGFYRFKIGCDCDA